VTTFGEYFVRSSAVGVDPDANLRKERERLGALLAKSEARLGDPSFLAHAPPEVVREAEAKARELKERLRRIDAHLAEAPASTAGP
jgi:valyl-tRNA synthetase